MRRFFVYFLPLGVFTLTSQLISAQLPDQVEELEKLETLWNQKFQQTPTSGPFVSGKAAAKAFVFIGKEEK